MLQPYGCHFVLHCAPQGFHTLNTVPKSDIISEYGLTMSDVGWVIGGGSQQTCKRLLSDNHESAWKMKNFTKVSQKVA